MASSFAITTATNSIQLGNNRRTEAIFTVFNASGRPVRGRARVIAENPLAQAWLSLSKEAEQDFQIAGAQQYPVTIVLPPEAPAGQYTFRLDMIGIANPDEDYTQGPTITFEAPAPIKSKTFPWWIPAIAVLVLVAAGTLAYFLLRTVAVPEVATLSISDATAALTDVDLKVGQTQLISDDTIPENSVIRTEPPAGSKLRPNSPVDLIISAGPLQITLPDVDDRQQADAKNILENTCTPSPCLIVQSSTESSTATAVGRIIRTEPPRGTRVPKGSSVTLIVSSGPPSASASLIADADRYWDPPNIRYLVGRLPKFGEGSPLSLWNSSTFGGNGLIALHFDLSTLPDKATIQHAELQLFLESGNGAKAQVTVLPATSDWTENKSTRPNCATRGGVVQTVGLASDSYHWDITTLAKSLQAPGAKNFGFCLLISGNGLERKFTSREGSQRNRPRLVITYQP